MSNEHGGGTNMPRGGRRPGAGRPRRPIPKARPIWVGQIGEEQRRYIIERLTPQERLNALLEAARRKENKMSEARQWYEEYRKHGGTLTWDEVIAEMEEWRQQMGPDFQDMWGVSNHLYELSHDQYLRGDDDWRETRWLAEIAEKMAIDTDDEDVYVRAMDFGVINGCRDLRKRIGDLPESDAKRTMMKILDDLEMMAIRKLFAGIHIGKIE